MSPQPFLSRTSLVRLAPFPILCACGSNVADPPNIGPPEASISANEPPETEGDQPAGPDAGSPDASGPAGEWLASPHGDPYALVGIGESELYAQGATQLLRSTDRGTSFRPVTIDGAATLTPTLCANGIRVGLAAGVLFHSEDGEAWSRADTTAIWSGESFPTTDIACDDKGAVYATRPSYRTLAEHTVAVSKDRGKSWQRYRTWKKEPGIPAGIIWTSTRELRVVLLDGSVCNLGPPVTCTKGLAQGRVLNVMRLPSGNFLEASDSKGVEAILYRIDPTELVELARVRESTGALREVESAIVRFRKTDSGSPTTIDWSPQGTEWTTILTEPIVYSAWVTPAGQAFVASSRGLFRR